MAAMETFTGWHTWSDAEPGLTRRLPAEVTAEIARAVEFATSHHGDQRRKTGVPYLEHLLEAVLRQPGSKGILVEVVWEQVFDGLEPGFRGCPEALEEADFGEQHREVGGEPGHMRSGYRGVGSGMYPGNT